MPDNMGALVPFTDQPGLSIGAQVLQATQARAAAGLPMDSTWALNVWTQAGLTAQQAIAMHNYLRNWQLTTGKAVGESDINEAIGQVKATGSIDANAWSSQRVTSPQAPAGTTPPATTTPPAAPAPPAAPVTTASPAAPGAPPVASAGPAPSFGGMSRFLNGLSGADLNASLAAGNFAGVAESLIGNYEGAAGGRFNPYNRSYLSSITDDLSRLGLIDSLNGRASGADAAQNLGTSLENRLSGAAGPLEGTGGRDSLGALYATLSNPANTAARATYAARTVPNQIGDVTAAVSGAYNPLLRASVAKALQEAGNRYSTIDLHAAPGATGSFLDLARQLGYI